jgi:hypothetical protein
VTASRLLAAYALITALIVVAVLGGLAIYFGSGA